MKKIMVFSLVLVSTGVMGYELENQRPYKDIYGHSYKNEQNMNKDSDGDGVINRYDYNDKDSRIRTKYDSEIYKPRKSRWGY